MDEEGERGCLECREGLCEFEREGWRRSLRAMAGLVVNTDFDGFSRLSKSPPGRCRSLIHGLSSQ